MYGHVVTLNFDDNDSYKTFIGGAASIIVKSFLALYCILNFKKMVSHDDNKLISIIGLRDVNINPVLFNETHMVPYAVFRKQIGP